jgi:hypothetical protein
VNDGWKTRGPKVDRKGEDSGHRPSDSKYNNKTMTARESQAVEGTRCLATGNREQSYKRRPKTRRLTKSAVLLSILAAAPTALAQECISLSGSTACPAFNLASISLASNVTNLLYVLHLPERLSDFAIQLTLPLYSPFLKSVHDTVSFDQQLLSYVKTSYVQLK